MNGETEGQMQQHLCSCKVDLAGEKLTIVAFDETNPIPWPEILILQAIHGDESIFDIMPVALGPRDTPLREKQRWANKYGSAEVEAVYAGKAFVVEWFVPGWPIDPAKGRKRKPNDRPRAPRLNKPDDAGADDVRI